MEGQIGEKKIENEGSGGTDGEKKIENEGSGGTDRGEKDREQEAWRDR